MENKSKLNITTFDDDDYIEVSTNILVNLINDLLKENHTINIALSGGTSPLPIYNKLSACDVNWKLINIYLVDERCVPNESDESNYKNIREVLFCKVDSRTFPMVVEGYSYLECARSYNKKVFENLPILNGFPQFDLIVLGMGLDGHTASLFPNTKALHNSDDAIVLNEVPQLQAERITMTYPLILNAKKIILIARGEEKRKILNNLMDNNYPVSKIIPQIYTILN